jgi:hypothetical protein
VAISNKTYTVQYRNALGDSPWNWLTDVVATATNRLETIIDTGAASGRYYRLVTPLQP